MVNAKENRLSVYLFIVAISASVSSIILGLIVIFGWYSGNKSLIQVLPSFVPMQYNTALGFLLCGSGILFLEKFENRYVVMGMGILAIALGGLTLFEYSTGFNLGIDELFMAHTITVKTSHPGRMAPNTALCFILIGAYLVFATFGNRRTYLVLLRVAFVSLVFGLSVVAMSGYIGNLVYAYSWGRLTQMAMHTAIGFIVLSTGSLSHVWHSDVSNKTLTPYWLPVPVTIGILTVTICLCQALQSGHSLIASRNSVVNVQPYLHTKKFINNTPIKVGILHSLTGTMSISAKPVVESTLLAIDNINQHGGILGRMIKPVVIDGQSDLNAYAVGVERLIVEENVSVVFGCWTSASRKTVKPIIEKYEHLLFYPIQYEGIEQSSHIVYTGATPNQQIIPAVKWCINNLGKKYFLVGSDYVFPRVANSIAKDYIVAHGGEVSGEEYILLGSIDVQEVIQKIKSAKPDVILNTINGSSNIAFFNELRNSGITSDKIPTMSFSIGETDVQSIGLNNVYGDYACWNYFQSIETEENKEFVAMFKEKYGMNRVVSDPMEAAYFGVMLWFQAVVSANTVDILPVRKALKKQDIVAPEGSVHVEPTNNHVLKATRIGKLRKDGQFDVVWVSERLRRPRPYPVYRTREEWVQKLQSLYKGWNNHWSAKDRLGVE